MAESLLSPLDVSAFETYSPGWLEQLAAQDLEALEAELQAAVDAQVGRQAASEAEQQRAIDDECRESALFWLQHYTATENPKHKEQGLAYKAPFPRKTYFRPLFEEFARARRLFIPKTREMLTSWCVIGDSTHRAQWQRWFTVIQTEAEAKAAELISYAAILYENQPDWMKKLHPLKRERSLTNIEWENGGRLLAIPKGAHKIRLYHPTRYVMDEAAFLAEAESCYNSAQPVCQQIIAISSAGPGWFGDQCSR